jgi:hypothetical protein
LARGSPASNLIEWEMKRQPIVAGLSLIGTLLASSFVLYFVSQGVPF